MTCTDRQRAALVRAREKRSELDDAVTCNLAPDELALWRKVRGQFKGSPHARLEAFREYAAEHPGEVIAALPDVDAFPFGANEVPRGRSSTGSRGPAPGPARRRQPSTPPDRTVAGVTWGALVGAELNDAARTIVLRLVAANRAAVASGERPVHVSAVVAEAGLASREAVIAYLRTLKEAA